MAGKKQHRHPRAAQQPAAQPTPEPPPADEVPPPMDEFAVPAEPHVDHSDTQMVRREEAMGAVEVRGQGMAEAAIESQLRADVEAHAILAMKRPRDIDQARVAILKDCRRPRFAESAMYRKPIGNTFITGLSIRFAEAAMRAYRNMLTQAIVLDDGPAKRLTFVAVRDLEANISHAVTVVTEKTVERKNLRQGQVPLRSRLNSQGQVVYLVEATEDDVLTKNNANVSKAMRTGILRVIPGDLQEEARDQIEATLKNKAAQDPDAERKRIADAFASMGIQPEALAKYLGHELGTTTPAEIVTLRGIFNALKSGETNWGEVMASRHPETPPPQNGGGNGTSRAEQIKAQMRAQQAPQPPSPQTPPPPSDEPVQQVGLKPPPEDWHETAEGKACIREIKRIGQQRGWSEEQLDRRVGLTPSKPGAPVCVNLDEARAFLKALEAPPTNG